jgi:transposase
VPAIAGRLGCHPKKVRRWLHRFNAGGLDGLGDRPGAGRRRRITEAQRSAVIALARSAPPGRLARDGAGELPAEDEDGPPEWTLDSLSQAAREAGIAVGRSQVRRILLAGKVRHPRRRADLLDSRAGDLRGPDHVRFPAAAALEGYRLRAADGRIDLPRRAERVPVLPANLLEK